jgi:hypothetical protein
MAQPFTFRCPDTSYIAQAFRRIFKLSQKMYEAVNARRARPII